MKLYRVKEVCETTGLTRKQLFDYQKIVKPTSYEKAGYKLYDEDALRNLVMVSKLRSIDVPLADIKAFLEGRRSKEEVIMSQIKALEERQEKVDEMIEKARNMLNEK